MSYSRSFRLMLTAALCSLSSVSLSYASPVEAKSEYVTKQEFGSMVEQYLMEHPEAMLQSLEKMQRETQEKGVEQSKKAITEQQDKLFANPALPSVGPKDAAIPVVEFFDYNCSACKYMFHPIDTLYAKKPADVRFIFVEFPIFGEKSEDLSKIALAVHKLKPDAYYAFHGAMMKHKGTIDKEQAYKYVEQVGIVRADLEKELMKPDYDAQLKANKDLGHALNVSGTPYMVIGKTPVPHALDAENLEKHIEDERKALNNNATKK